MHYQLHSNGGCLRFWESNHTVVCEKTLSLHPHTLSVPYQGLAEQPWLQEKKETLSYISLWRYLTIHSVSFYSVSLVLYHPCACHQGGDLIKVDIHSTVNPCQGSFVKSHRRGRALSFHFCLFLSNLVC